MIAYCDVSIRRNAYCSLARTGLPLQKKSKRMMTREEIAAIDCECEERHISQQNYLESHGIAKHQYYRWKRRYREEDEQSLVPAGFVPMTPGAAPAVPSPRSRSKQQKSRQDQESFLTVEIRTSRGSAMRIQGDMTAAHLREIISASDV